MNLEQCRHLKSIISIVSENATITVEALPEHVHPRDCFELQEDIDHVLEQAEWNEWGWCCVKVTAEYKGLSESEYLGACSYESEADFRANSGYYEDLVNTAVECLAVRVYELITEVNRHA